MEKTAGALLAKEKEIFSAAHFYEERLVRRLRRGEALVRARVPGQGTTEYAILVGVLVVIAILAITVIAPKVQELWDAVATGLNNL